MPDLNGGVALAQVGARDRAHQDGGDLAHRSGDEHHDRHRRQRDPGASTVRCQVPCHAPDRLRNDRHGHEFQVVQKSLGHRPGKGRRGQREGQQDQRGRHREGEPRDHAAQQAIAAQHAERKPDLAGSRPRHELAQRDKIDVSGLIDPFPSNDEFVTEIAQMRDRPAE